MKQVAAVLVVGLGGCLSGCTTSQVDAFAYPTHSEVKRIADHGAAITERVRDSLSNEHKEIALAVGADVGAIDAIRAQAAADVAAMRAEVAAMESSVAGVVRDYVAPLSERLLGFSLIIDDVKEKVANVPVFTDMVKDQARDVAHIEERLSDQKVAVDGFLSAISTVSDRLLIGDATMVNRVIAAAASDPSFRVVMADIGIKAADVEAIFDKRDALKPDGVDLQTLLTTALGAGGLAFAGARKMGSGSKVAALKQEVEDIKTGIAASTPVAS